MQEIEVLLTSRSGVDYIFTATAEIIDVGGLVKGSYHIKLFDTKYNELIFKSSFSDSVLTTYYNGSLKEYAHRLVESYEDVVVEQIDSFITKD